MKSIASILTLAIVAILACAGHWLSAGVTLFLAGNLLAPPSMRLCVTLTADEILLDVIDAFAKSVPAINRMGISFSPKQFKLNQEYIAHIPTIPTVEDVSTTYAVTGQFSRDLLTDVSITVDKHRACLLKWKHLDAIKDQKNEYAKIIGLAGYALAKSFVDDILASVGRLNFTQETIAATADFDLDVIQSVCGSMNLVGAHPTGRVLLVSTAVANVIAADTRISSSLYYGQKEEGNSLREWHNVGGFALIKEYADLPTNNGATKTVTAIEADDNVCTTSAAHGLVVGDRITFPTLTGGTGVTAGTTVYVVISVPSTTTFTFSATEGGSAVDCTVDATAGTVKKTENITAFAFDSRAIASLAGIPYQFDSEFLNGLNIPRTMGMQAITHPELGISMAAVSWQDVGTGALNWAPSLVWGKALGRQGVANAAGAKCDYAGHIIRSA